MASLTAPIKTPEAAPGVQISLAVKDSTTVYAGALVAINSSGKAEPAADASGLRAVGRAENTAADGAAVRIRRKGVFRYANDTVDAVTAAMYGQVCYVKDDHTVSSSAGSYAVVAGRVVRVDADGVWVELDGGAFAPSAAITDLATTPAASDVNAILAALRKAGIIANS